MRLIARRRLVAATLFEPGNQTMNTTASPPTDLARFVARAVRSRELSSHLRQIVQQTRATHVAVRDLDNVLSGDVELARDVMRVAGSFSGDERGEVAEITDVAAAAERFGARNILLLAASQGLVRECLHRAEARMRLRFWRETLVRAVAARQFAARVQPAVAVAALAAGMVRSLGMLVLSETLGQPYHDLLDETESRRGDGLHLERVSLGFDHTALTARLLEAWKFSPDFAAAVASDPALDAASGATGDKTLSRLLRAANLLSDLLVRQRHAVLPDFLLVAEDHFELANEQLPDFVGEVEEGVQRLAAALEVPAAGYRGLRDTWLRLRLQQKSAEPQAETLLAETQLLQDFASAALTPARRLEVSRNDFAPHAGDQSESLLPTLSAAVTACRLARRPISLLIVEIDHFHEWVRVPEQCGLATIVDRVGAALRELAPEPRHVARTGESRFAIILEGADRQLAVSTARSLLADLHQTPRDSAGRPSSPATFNAGLATLAAPSKNFPPQELLNAAHRCLQAAHTAGGNTVKSIDIY